MQRQPLGDEALPRQLIPAVALRVPVLGIPRDGTADVGEMRAYLVRLSRVQDHLDERPLPFASLHAVFGDDLLGARRGPVGKCSTRARSASFFSQAVKTSPSFGNRPKQTAS